MNIVTINGIEYVPKVQKISVFEFAKLINLPFYFPVDFTEKSTNVYYKLCKITEFMNIGKTMGKWIFLPFVGGHATESASAGPVYVTTANAASNADTDIGSRLGYYNRADAEVSAKHFEEDWKMYKYPK